MAYHLMKYWKAPDGTVYEVCDGEARKLAGDGVGEDELNAAVKAALEEAKASGAFKGDPGEPGEKGDPGQPGPAGSDANVTAVNIKSALGYTPADAEDVHQLSADKANTNETMADMVVGTEVGAKCAELSALMKDAGSEVESFIFFTDPHLLASEADYEAKFRKYIRTLKTYYAATPSSFVVCGGDWLELHNRAEACFRLGYVDGWMRNNFDRYYPVVGNHDHNANISGVAYPEEDDVGTLPIDTVRNLMMRSEGNTYYAFDGVSTKFYVLDSGPDWWNMTDHMWEQVAWLGEMLKTNDDKNTAIIVHAAFEKNKNTGELEIQAFTNNVLTLCGAYNRRETLTLNNTIYNFKACGGSVRFMLSGHTHRDYQDAICDIPVIATSRMSVDGKETFDLCLVDYDNDVLHMVRVGSGENRSIPICSGAESEATGYVILRGIDRSGNKMYGGVKTRMLCVTDENPCELKPIAWDGNLGDTPNYPFNVSYYPFVIPDGVTKITITCPSHINASCDYWSLDGWNGADSRIGYFPWMTGGGTGEFPTDAKVFWIYFSDTTGADTTSDAYDVSNISFELS